jgi:DNA-binding transcriptional regulator YiaG
VERGGTITRVESSLRRDGAMNSHVGWPKSVIGNPVMELRYFGGLTLDEMAHALGNSAATVEREWEPSRRDSTSK